MALIDDGAVETAAEEESRPKNDAARREKLLKQALEHWAVCESGWKDNREAARDDLRFQAGEQWPAKMKKEREDDGRPCLTVDKINQYVRQVVNDGRQNRPQIKVHPVDDQGDPKVAEAFMGIIRHIWRRGGDQAADTALGHAAGSGFGWIRVGTDYERESSFDQELRLLRVRNPLAAMLDPNAMEADGSDARYGFVIDEIPKDRFKKKWPKAKFTDWKADLPKYADGWIAGDNVRVVEYFYVVEEPRNLLLLATGETVEEADYWRAVKELGRENVPKIEDSRSMPVCTVKWCRLSGAEVLEENDWQGKYVPIVPVYGNEYDVDGKVMYCGLIRPAKDAQRLYNYMRSAFAESVGNATQDFWVAADAQLEGYEAEWDSDSNSYVRRYKPVDAGGERVPPPFRATPATLPTGMAADMQHSEHDIQASMGMYASTTLGVGNAQSGKQEMLQQRRGDTSTFHYQDNLNRAYAQVGRILVDLIPKYYGSRKAARILGEDGKAEIIETNPDQGKAYLKLGSKKIYNFNVGLYDASVEVGPSFATKRQETAALMQELANRNPQVFALVADVMFRNMDIPEADKVARRFELMLPPQVQEAEDEDMTPEAARIMARAKQAMGQMQEQLKAAEGGIAERDAALQEQAQELAAAKAMAAAKRAEASAKLQDADTRAFQADTDRIKELLAAMLPGEIQTLVQQAVQSAITNPSPGTPGQF
jgi:hypothetical protein